MVAWFKAVGLAAVGVFAPVQAIMVVILVLVMLDLVTGILAAQKRAEVISAARLRRSISKMVAYQSALIAGYLLEVFILGSAIPVAKLIGAAVGVVEATSCLENANTIAGKSIFGAVLARLGSRNDLPLDK